MTGLEKIIDRIQTEARERASEILQRSEEECVALAKDYAARAEALRESIEKTGEQDMQSMLLAARAQTQKERAAILQKAQNGLLDEAFARAQKEITSDDCGKYRELLVALLVLALLDQHRTEQQSIAYGDEVEELTSFEVLLNAKDRALYGTQVVEGARRVVERRIGAEKARKLVLADEAADIDGGLVLRFGDVELNCTLGLLMADIRRELTPRVSALLFGE